MADRARRGRRRREESASSDRDGSRKCDSDRRVNRRHRRHEDRRSNSSGSRKRQSFADRHTQKLGNHVGRSRSRHKGKDEHHRGSVAAETKHCLHCSTSAGDFVIELVEEWSPLGVQRFLDLVADNFFDDQLLYRVMPGFIVQFGVAADSRMQAKWEKRMLRDERTGCAKFKNGTVSFAGTGQKDSRSCHVFIACEPGGITLGEAFHETPIGQVVVGLEVLEQIQDNYEDAGYPENLNIQEQLVKKGNSAASEYPKLDRIKKICLL